MFWSNSKVTDPELYNNNVKFKQSRNEVTDYYTTHMVLLNDHNKEIGRVTINEVPSCCGMLFINNLCVYQRGVGRGAMLLASVKQFAQLGEYTAIQCVIADDANTVGVARKKKCFMKAGFKQLRGSRFKNSRSGNYCSTYQLIMENK